MINQKIEFFPTYLKQGKAEFDKKRILIFYQIKKYRLEMPD
jgi:hypothetical protein